MPRNEAWIGNYVKDVFCLEGEWTSDLRHPSSLEPILQLLRNRDPKFAYVHRFVVSVSELNLFLKKWTLKKYQAYPILYLACHGTDGHLFFSSPGRSPGVSFDDLEEQLTGKCRKRIVCLGSCSSLDHDGRRIEQFLELTSALAVCGYRFDVDWMIATAFELLLLAALQDNAPTVSGMRAASRRIRE